MSAYISRTTEPSRIEVLEQTSRPQTHDDVKTAMSYKSSDSPSTYPHLGILVMGLTGVGKSTFISKLSQEPIDIGHSLESCTTVVEAFAYRRPDGQTVYLIDTPGFDDSHKDNVKVLEEIARHLTTFYVHDVLRILGMVYFHRISDVRMSGSSMKSLRIFEKLCGPECFTNVVIVTTFWRFLQGDQNLIGERREECLRTDDSLFGTLVKGGAQMLRLSDSDASAHGIIESMLDRLTPVVLSVQREVVDDRLTLAKTTVGHFLEGDLVAVREKYERALQELNKDIDEADIDGQNEDYLRTILDEKAVYEEHIKQGKVAMDSLSITYEDMVQKQQDWLLGGMYDGSRNLEEPEEKSARELELEEQLERTEMDFVRQMNKLRHDNHILRRDNEAQFTDAFHKGHQTDMEYIQDLLKDEQARRRKPQAKTKSKTLRQLIRTALAESVEILQRGSRRADSFPLESRSSTKQRWAIVGPSARRPTTQIMLRRNIVQRSQSYQGFSQARPTEPEPMYENAEERGDGTWNESEEDESDETDAEILPAAMEYPEGTVVGNRDRIEYGGPKRRADLHPQLPVSEVQMPRLLRSYGPPMTGNTRALERQ